MRDNQVQNTWSPKIDGERCAITAKQRLGIPDGSPSMMREFFNPEVTTAGSALEASPSGSERLELPDISIGPSHLTALPIYAGGYEKSPGSDEAGILPLTSVQGDPFACAWSTVSQPRGDAHQIVHCYPAPLFQVTSRKHGSAAVPDADPEEASRSSDEELHAFSSQLQQALLQVKQHAENGFLTAKASVYRRLVHQLNAEREQELQRLEEARQEAQSARILLHSLRRSKEATEERLSRVHLFLRRRTLRQKARQQQQDAFQRWSRFASRRSRRRRDKNILISLNKRAYLWRVFVPWRIEVLKAAAARRQQTAALQAQAAMDHQLTLAKAGKAREEQLTQHLRQRLHAETNMRLRLQENLRHIFLEGASAICGTHDSACKRATLEGMDDCMPADTSQVHDQGKFQLKASEVVKCPVIAIRPKASAAPKQTARACSGASKAPREGAVISGCPGAFSTAETSILHRRGTDLPAETEATAVQNKKTLMYRRVAVTSQQRLADGVFAGLTTDIGDEGLYATPTKAAYAAEEDSTNLPFVLMEEPVQRRKLVSNQVQCCLTGSNSLEVIGQTLVPTMSADRLLTKTTELSETCNAPTAKMQLSFSCEAAPQPCDHTRCCDTTVLDSRRSQGGTKQFTGKREPTRTNNNPTPQQRNFFETVVDQHWTTCRTPVCLLDGQHRKGPGLRRLTAIPEEIHGTAGSYANCSQCTVNKTCPLARASDRDTSCWVISEKQHLKGYTPVQTGINCKHSAYPYAGRHEQAGKAVHCSTVTYPGGLAGSRRKACWTLQSVSTRTPGKAARAPDHPRRALHTNFSCSDICAASATGRRCLQTNKHCNWVKS